MMASRRWTSDLIAWSVLVVVIYLPSALIALGIVWMFTGR